MANPRPITPVGGRDIFDNARQQDLERQQREAQDHFDRTGERVPVYQPVDPLVPINGHSEPDDIASDGDAYDNEGRIRNPAPREAREAFDGMFGAGYTEHMSHQRQLREQAMASEAKRDKDAENKKKEELAMLKEQTKKKFSNAIAGLEVDDDDEK